MEACRAFLENRLRDGMGNVAIVPKAAHRATRARQLRRSIAATCVLACASHGCTSFLHPACGSPPSAVWFLAPGRCSLAAPRGGAGCIPSNEGRRRAQCATSDHGGRRRIQCAASAKGADTQRQDEEKANRGYRFGDLFINKLTGKDSYEFGDLSRFLDKKAKEAACHLTGEDEYKFGDISRYFDAKAKDEVRKLTGKEKYELGDISKEIARRVQAGEVDQEDMSLLIRGVLSFGLGLSPVAHLLPVQFLLGVLSWNLQAEMGQRVSGKISSAVASELDRRAKGALLGEGNEDYVLGDMTRKQLQKAVTSITGKDGYEFGDISKVVLSNMVGTKQELDKPAPARKPPQ